MSYCKFIFLASALVLSAQAQNNATHRVFPEGFIFGAATASYQVEGAWNVSGKGENIWDHLTHNSDLVDDLSSGDVATNSYYMYPRDIEMLKELGVEYYRFSISWTRILPTGFDDKVSAEGVDYYNRLIDMLIENNLKPVVTIYHWDLPQSLQNIGGWPNPLIAKYYTDFARVAFEAFGDRVTDWLTFNEPFEICQSGYGLKAKAPALNFQGVANYLCAHTLLKAHASAWHLYDDVFRPTQGGRVGLTLNAGWKEPNSNSTGDLEASETALEFSLGWFAHPIFTKKGDYPEVVKANVAKRSAEQGYSSSRLPSFTPEEVEYISGTFDFFGLNHYTSSMVRVRSAEDDFPIPSYHDDLGAVEFQDPEWPGSPIAPWLKVVPWGFRKLLVWMKDNYDNPEIIIMENGYSDLGVVNDLDRINYYQHYLNALLDALEEGVHVSAYTAWSLLDNFEWMSGYTEKFGLYYVDFNDPARPRTQKLSAKYMSQVFQSKTLQRV